VNGGVVQVLINSTYVIATVMADTSRVQGKEWYHPGTYRRKNEPSPRT